LYNQLPIYTCYYTIHHELLVLRIITSPIRGLRKQDQEYLAARRAEKKGAGLFKVSNFFQLDERQKR
jgi:hypothetical protein